MRISSFPGGCNSTRFGNKKLQVGLDQMVTCHTTSYAHAMNVPLKLINFDN